MPLKENIFALKFLLLVFDTIKPGSAQVMVQSFKTLRVKQKEFPPEYSTLAFALILNMYSFFENC